MNPKLFDELKGVLGLSISQRVHFFSWRGVGKLEDPLQPSTSSFQNPKRKISHSIGGNLRHQDKRSRTSHSTPEHQCKTEKGCLSCSLTAPCHYFWTRLQEWQSQGSPASISKPRSRTRLHKSRGASFPLTSNTATEDFLPQRYTLWESLSLNLIWSMS